MPLRDGYHWNPEKCKECGGKCCQLFRDWEDLLDRPHKIIEARLSRYFEHHGIKVPESRFDINRAFQPDEETYRMELADAGIDISFCEYNHPEIGCIVPWEDRPAVCRAYYCDHWQKTVDVLNSTLG